MRTFAQFVVLLLIVARGVGAAITATPMGNTVRLTNGVVDLRVDLATGALCGFALTGQPSRVTHSAVDLVVEAGGSRFSKATPSFEAWQATPDGLDVTWRAAGWRVTEHWRLSDGSPCVRRSVTIVPPDDAGVLTQVRLRLDGLHLPGAADASVVLPHSFPISARAVADNHPGTDRSAGGGNTNRLVVLRSAALDQALVVLGDDGDDPSWAHVTEQAGSIDVEHVWNAEAQLKGGVPITVGTQVLTSALASTDAVTAASWDAFDRLGRRVPADRRADVDRTVVYSAHAGGTIDSDWRDTGGFGAMTARLDRIAALGVNTLWMLPFWKGWVYAPVDYAAHDDKLGTEAQLRDLVATAGRRGVRVLADLVPHGPREESGLLAQHPDWVSRDRAGQPIIWWGCLSCDYAHPGWQGYMADHAVDWMKRVGLAGYRVDVAGGGPSNWRPYDGNRPSNSSLKGSHDLLATVRSRIKRQDAGAMLIQEGTSPQLATTGDLIYDFPWAYEVLPRVLEMPLPEWQAALADWLAWRPAQYPRGTKFMRYVTSHDTIRGLPRYGANLHRGLLLLTALVDGAPMLYDREEAGHEFALAPLLRARGALLPAAGPVEYPLAAKGSDLLCWRPASGRRLPLVAINLSHQRQQAELPGPVAGLTWTRLGADGPSVARAVTHVELQPGEAGILTDNAWATPTEAPPAPPRQALPPAGDLLAVKAGDMTLRVDPRRGGAIDSLWLGDAAGAVRLADAESWREGERKLFPGTPPLDLTAFAATASRAGNALECRGVVAGKLRVTRRYEARDGIVCTMTLEATEPVQGANCELRQVLGLRGERWRADTIEGTLAGTPDPTVKPAQPREWPGYRYRHAAGPLWRDSTLPLAGGCGVQVGGAGLMLTDVNSALPELPHDILLCDNGHGADVVLDWFTGRQPVTLLPGQPITLSFRLTTGRETARSTRLTCQGGNWHVRNQHFEAVIGRSAGGSLRELRRLTNGTAGPSLVAGTNSYTDNGLYQTWTDPLGQQHKTNVGSNLDVEPDVRVDDRAGRLRLTFQGVLSGDQGFGMSIQRPYTWYRHEFVVDDGPALHMKLGIRPRAGFERRDVAAFAAHTLRFLRVTNWSCAGTDGTSGGAMPPDRFERLWQSREHGGVGPGQYKLTIDGRQLVVTVRAGAESLQNAFLLSGIDPVLFLAHYDNQPVPIAPTWREVELEIQP